MPSWLTEVMKLLGFTPALIYAAATYGFFLWLDKKASGPAKKAISDWLVPKVYDRTAVAAAILELFDRVYTHPLLAWRALRRSAAITAIVAVITAYESDAHLMHYYTNMEAFIFSITTINNILGDFATLFVIRWWLRHTISPIRALILGPSIAIVLIAVLQVLQAFWLSIGVSFAFPGTQEDLAWQHLSLIEFPLLLVRHPPDRGSVAAISIIAASAVHLWLPFLALCVGLLKGLNYFLLAAHTAQWFLKRGKDHPLEAVGLVAAPLVFIATAAVQLMLR